MKNLKLLSLILTLGGAVLAQAQTAPPAINYQGRLTQATGVVVPDGLTGMRVRIFATASGGSALWDSGDLSVATKSGTFSILLGSGGMPAMSPAVFALGSVYIEVQPAGQAPLLPRQPIATVPWAFYAQTVSDGAITTGKLGDLQVTSGKLANSSVTATKLVDGAVTNAKVANDSIDSSKLATDLSALGKLTGGRLSTASDWTSIQGVTYAAGYSSGLLLKNPQGGNEWVLGLYNGGLNIGKWGGPDLAVYVAPNGNLGLGQWTPQAKLDVNGNALVSGNLTVPNIMGPSGGTLYLNPFVGNSSTVQVGAFQNCDLNVTGRITIGGSPVAGRSLMVNGAAGGTSLWTQWSDRRIKRNIEDIPTPLRTLLQLAGKSYQYKTEVASGLPTGVHYGFIAQEVENVLPFWVSQQGPYKSLATSEFDALAVEAIREQQQQIETLRKENAQLRRQNAAFESRLGSIEAKLKH